METVIGQISHEQFAIQYPDATIKVDGTATTIRGSTVNYWRQHEDRSWTNYNCRTVDRI